MKTSNKILLGLFIGLFATLIWVDFSLQAVYAKINLSDAFKNYQNIAVQPFKHLKITGGNAYAIEIRQAEKFDMKVMTSRASFLKTTAKNDTLFVRFLVAGSPQNRFADDLPLGLIISCPSLIDIVANGTNNFISNWHSDSLNISLTGNASAKFNDVKLHKLIATGNHNSVFDFQMANQLHKLSLHLNNSSSAYFKGIDYQNFEPLLSDSAVLVLKQQASDKLRKP